VVDESNDGDWWAGNYFILTFGEDGRFVYGLDGMGAGLFGTWAVENELIAIRGGFSTESTEMDNSNHIIYLRNIRFIDNINLTLYNGITKKTERLTNNWSRD